MRFSTLALGALASTTTSARINGIAAPSTLAPGSKYNLTLVVGNFQYVNDVAVAWSFNAPRNSFANCIGNKQWTSSAYLDPSLSNIDQNITIEARVPQDFENYVGQKMALTAGVYSLYGDTAGVQVAGFNVTVNIGTKTGGALVGSTRRWW